MVEGRWRSLRTAWRNSPTLLFLNKFGTLEGTGLTVAEVEELVVVVVVLDAVPEREEVALGEVLGEDVADNEQDAELDPVVDNEIVAVLEGVTDNEVVGEYVVDHEGDPDLDSSDIEVAGVLEVVSEDVADNELDRADDNKAAKVLEEVADNETV